jgi:hypothetical protein|tara:strand:+ start:464 stop:1018 length:555 start_codon:yes stop_codon:yes gene_type:complete
MANWYNEQLTNNNYLSPIGFLFVLDKAKKVSFLCQRASIPDLTLGNVDLPTRGLVPIPTEGNIQYGELTIDFIVDENLENYMQIHNWMRALGTPQSIDDRTVFKAQEEPARGLGNEYRYSDGSLMILNNNNNSNFDVVFKSLWPINLSTLSFDVTGSDNEFFTASATFKYTLYEVRDTNSQTRR